MPEAPAYQSGLIAALRGSESQPSQVSVPGVTMMPNAPRPVADPALIDGNPRLTGNLMPSRRISSFPKSLPPSSPNFSDAIISPIPKSLPPPSPTFSAQPETMFNESSMTGNLMPVPQFAPAQTYIPPPPSMPPTAPAAPPFYTDEESGYRWTYNADGDLVPYYGGSADDSNWGSD